MIGSSFPGAPYVVLGQNQVAAWGSTVHPMDVTDMFFDTITSDPDSPSGLRIVHAQPDDALDRIDLIPLSFFFNVIGDGAFDNVELAPFDDQIPPLAFTVPRRMDGPIVSLDLVGGEALTIQYTGFGATREVEAFRAFNKVRNFDDFVEALQIFDVGSQNFAYIDVFGTVAYTTSAELPIREDLQAGAVDGLPPFFVREGAGGNEWAAVSNPQPGQATPYEVLPYAEMPQIMNPPAGYFINANNDPIGNSLDNDPLNEMRPGGGIFYLNPGYAIGTRAGSIRQALEAKIADGPVDASDMADVQADVNLLDAQVLAPYIEMALSRAQMPDADPTLAALGADASIVEAIGRLAAWNYSSPTGIPEGYDASDTAATLADPDAEEIANSVATTIYSVWRGQFIRRTVDATLDRVGALAGLSMPGPGSGETMKALRNLLDNFDTNQGIGASGLDFFAIDGSDADAADRRDILILDSIAAALALLASDEFAPAFGNSSNQDDYRWGKLHRIVLDHPLGDPFSTPPAGGLFPAPLPGLDGIPVDGGFGVADASSHSARADGLNEFMFGSGPTRRFVAQPGAISLSMRAQSSMPGGTSGVLGDEFSVNLLAEWLANDAHPLRQRIPAILDALAEVTRFAPAE